jgi:DNA-binding NarL/FixJ family response regulator
LLRNFTAIHQAKDGTRAQAPFVSRLSGLFIELTGQAPAPGAKGLDPRQEKQRLFESLAQALLATSHSQPLLVVIEDLHWSDSTSLEFLLLLSQRIPSHPIFMLLTYRSDQTTPELTHFLAGLDRQRLGTELALKPMSPDDADAMLHAILQSEGPLSRDLSGAIFSLTDGNPFFIEELLKALVSSGDLSPRDGAWDGREISQLHIPRTVQDAVQGRMQQLKPATLQALSLAAVMGRRFDFQLLQELLGVQEDQLVAAIKDMVSAQLVVEESADRFAFRHALTREAVYGRLLARERQSMHRAVGEAMERLHGASLESQLANLSYHFYAGAAWEKALSYSRKAGEHARRLYAQQESIVHYSRAIVAARRAGIAIEPALLNARGHAYEILGDFQSALQDFEEALRIARGAMDGHAEWQTLIDLGFLWAGRDYGRTGEYFRRAEALARQLKDPRQHAHSLNRLGNWLVNMGQTAQGLEAHRQALQIFEQGQDEQGMADTHDLLGMALVQHGDQPGSFAEYQQAIHLFQALDDKRGLVSALIGSWHAYHWEEVDRLPPLPRGEALKLAMQSLELARRVGWSAGQAYVEWGIAIGLGNLGRLGEALAHGQESLRIATGIEHRQWITAAHSALGRIYVQRLQPEPALRYLEPGLELARELGSAWWTGVITTDLANACLLGGNPGAAESLLDPLTPPSEGHLTLVERRILLAKGSLLLAQGQPGQALELAQRLVHATGATGSTNIPAILKLKGQALLEMGHLDEAARVLEAARSGALQHGSLPLLWQLHAVLGKLFRRQKDEGRAEEEFACARQVLHEIEGNIPDEQRAEFLERAMEALPSQSKSRRRDESDKYGGLTRREREVARCLARGKSNREIARDMFLSERTVENHVSNILKKLGLASRAQVAVWVLEKGLGEEN